MFWSEMKKIGQPILWLVIVLICLVDYDWNLSFITKYWPNGSLVGHYQLAADWQERFGPRIEETEMALIREEHQELIVQADEQLSRSSLPNPAKIATYQEFLTWGEEHLSGRSREKLSAKEVRKIDQFYAIIDSLVDENGHSLNDRISQMEVMFESYQLFGNKEEFYLLEDFSNSEKVWLDEHLFGKEENWRTILPVSLAQTTSGHFEMILTLFILTSSLLIPAVFVRDRMRGVTKLQWASRTGRRVVWRQFGVTMVTSFLLLTLLLAVFGGLYLTTDFVQYFDNGLKSFLDYWEPTSVSFFTWTYGQWVLRLVLMVYLIGLSYSGVLFLLSQTSNHYLSLLMKVIPTAFVFLFISSKLFFAIFFGSNAFYQLTKLPHIELYLGIALLVVGLVCGLIPCLRSKKQELLT